MSIFEIRSFLGLAGYYERHENGLKLSIRDRIVGLRLWDMDSVTPQTWGSVDYSSTRGIQVEVGLPDTTFRKSGRVSFVRGALPK